MTQSEVIKQRSADELDSNLQEFLREKVNSFVKWDLVRFFHDNPYAADTAESIARYVGREYASITDELGELVKAGVLHWQEVSGRKIYKLASDGQMRELISKFVLACDDRKFRIKAINHVIRSMR
ncbi:MAG: hypothetical protein R3E39_21685 [Anaerolineae bacterium]